MKKLFLLMALFILTGKISAQFPHADTSYFFLFGNNSVDEFRDVCNHSLDSGYVAVGTTSSFSFGASDIYMVKTDWKGNTLWSRIFGSAGVENGYTVKETYDKGFIIGGFTNNTTNGDYDMLLIKTDSFGFVEWQKTFGGADWDFMYSLSLAPDSGFVLCGETYSFGNVSSNVYLLRTDKNGNMLWEKNYGGAGKDGGSKVMVTTDSFIVSAGYTESYGAGLRDLYLLKCDLNGDTVFTRTFGGAYNEEAYSIVEHVGFDNGYVMVGYTESFNIAQDKYIFLIKYDSTGTFMWQNNFGSSGNDVATCIFPENASFFVGGYTANGAGVLDVATGIVDAGGNWDWSQSASYGSFQADNVWANLKTLRGDYLFAGSTESFNSANGDAFFLLVDSIQPIIPQKVLNSSDTLVSVSEPQEFSLKIFPNPASSEVLITGLPGVKNAEYTIYDLNGKVIKNGAGFGSSYFLVDVRNMVQGTYVVKLRVDNETSFQKLIVIH